MRETNTSTFTKKDDDLLLIDEDDGIEDLTDKFNTADPLKYEEP